MRLFMKVLLACVVSVIGTVNASGWGKLEQSAGAWGNLQEEQVIAQTVASASGISSQPTPKSPPRMKCIKWKEVCGWEERTTTRCRMVQVACATTTWVCTAYKLTPTGRRVCAAGYTACVSGLVNMCNPVKEKKWICRDECIEYGPV